MTIASPPVTPPNTAVPAWLGSSPRRLRAARITVLVVVLVILAGVGVFVHRVHETVLATGMWSYAGNTPEIQLPYGGGSELVVDDTAGALHPIMFSVRNPGPATVTLQGVQNFLINDVAKYRVSPLGPNGPGLGVATLPQTSLSGVKIHPGQQVALWVYFKGQGCVSGSTGGASIITSIPLSVTVMGFQRVEWVAMPTLVAVMNNETAGAPSDPRSCLRHDS